MNALPMPNGATHNQSALALAEKVAAEVDGYKGAVVLGVRGAEVYDVIKDQTLVRADVLLQIGLAVRQMCSQWEGDLPEEALIPDFLTMRRRFKNFISREVTKSNEPYSVTATA